MDISKIASGIFNWNTILGKIAWGLLAWIWKSAWNKFKQYPHGMKQQIILGVLVTIGVTLILTLVNQIASRENLGFQASVLSTGPITGQGAQVTNSLQLPANSIGAESATLGASDLTNGSTFMMVLRVVNAGEPSVAWNWRAWYVLPNKKERIPAKIPNVANISGDIPVYTPFGPLRMAVENNLVQSLVTTELPRGQAVIGWVPIHIAGIAAVPWGTRFIVSFEDAFKHETTVEQTWDPPIQSMPANHP